jgi:hypothetical protein
VLAEVLLALLADPVFKVDYDPPTLEVTELAAAEVRSFSPPVAQRRPYSIVLPTTAVIFS